MNQLNLDGNVDQKVWETLKGNFEFERKIFADLAKEQETQLALQTREHMAFTALCLDHFTVLANLFPPAVFSMREEMNLPLDKDLYLKTFNNSVEKIRDATLPFLQAVQERLVD